MPEAYIYDALRTPRGRGKARGALYEVKPIDLLAAALGALRERTAIAPEELDDVVIGCVTPVDDQGYNVAKAALLHAGWGAAVGGMQVNRYCASGLEAVNLAAMKVRSGWENLVLAGGVESMSMIPMEGYKLAPSYQVATHTPNYVVGMGLTAEAVAKKYGVSREDQDVFALRSHTLAAAAIEEGKFKN